MRLLLYVFRVLFLVERVVCLVAVEEGEEEGKEELLGWEVDLVALGDRKGSDKY